MTDIVDTKYVDVKFEGGELKLVVPVKGLALELLKPLLEKLKAKIPGELDDKLIDKIVAEIEAL